MIHSHEEIREALGAYALHQLDDAELRQSVETHMETCDGCRSEFSQLVPIASALRGIDPASIDSQLGTPESLDRRIDAMFAGVQFERRRRLMPALTGALVGAAAASLAVVALPDADEPKAPTIIAVSDVATVGGVTATAGLVDHTWGVEVKLQVSGLPAGETYDMWIVGDDGSAYGAGEFVGVADTTINCGMSSSVLLKDAASFRVVDDEGAEVISGDLSDAV